MSPVAAVLRKTAQVSRWAIGADGSDHWVDVWSRAGRKYRTRAAILLTVDLVLFLGLCLFTYWLRTGRYLPFHGQEYYSLLMRSFQVSGTDQVSLTDMLLWPINVERTPLQLVVVALVMAALISVPVLVSILYRFPFALPFAAIVAFVAVMPWLGITGIGACALASLRPFRMHFRFGSALVGLVPFAIYLWLSTRSPGTPPPVVGFEQFKLYSPWGLSLMVACFHMAVVLSIASIVGYRPGAIAPVLAVLFLVPVGVFESRIGQDELYYNVLEARHGPSAPGGLKPQDLASFIEQQSEAEDVYQSVFGGVYEPPETLQRQWRLDLPAVAPLKQKVESLALAETEQNRFETVNQAERFISDFPESKRVPAALYLQGRALDTQLDLLRLRRDGSIGYYDDFPSPVSNGVWRSLAGSYPEHPLATVAHYRLAVQALRNGKCEDAYEHLRQALRLVERRRVTAGFPREGWFAVLMPSPAAEVESLGVEIEEVALQARQLLELVEANCRDPRYGCAPMALLMRMDERQASYRENLAWLDRQYPDATLHDNLRLLEVLTNSSVSVRIAELSEHVGQFPGQDSIPRATYELGRLLEGDTRFEDALQQYESLPGRFPKSVWSELAIQRTAVLKLQQHK